MPHKDTYSKLLFKKFLVIGSQFVCKTNLGSSTLPEILDVSC